MGDLFGSALSDGMADRYLEEGDTSFHKKHNPGGKVKTALTAGLNGDAAFSQCGRYRRILRRWTGEIFPERHILLCGMNPSTASGEHNDPTITREWGFTVREGYSAFVKVNISDYRATHPKELMKPGIVPVSPENLGVILNAAAEADKVVMCFGRVNRALEDAARQTVAALRDAGIFMWCFGTNKDGSPKHPLYLASDTPLIPFEQ